MDELVETAAGLNAAVNLKRHTGHTPVIWKDLRPEDEPAQHL